MKSWIITTCSKTSYAKLFIVASNEDERDDLLAYWEQQSADKESEQTGLFSEECEFQHDPNDFVFVDDDNYSGLYEYDNTPITFANLIDRDAGITILESGLNG